MVLMGIDPGYAITGYGVVEYNKGKFRILDYGVISTKAGTPFEKRMLAIFDGLSEIIGRFQPVSIAVEELFFNRNTTTAIGTAQARGIAVLCGARGDIPVYEYTPRQVKMAVTGYGLADKNQVQQMVRIILGLADIPRPDDAADALAIAICHAHSGADPKSLAVGGVPVMFAYLEGPITMKLPDAIVLDVGGVGYLISAAPGMMDRFRKVGERQRIHTHLSVREDAVTLYGFPTREELSLFEMLITVSGVGPKVASTIVADVTPSQFALAVVTDDTTGLTRVKGVGKKGAQRIILELKDKVGREYQSETFSATAATNTVGISVRSDAVSALMVLGYPAAQAARIVDQVYADGAGLEETIKAALTQLLR